VEASVIIDMPSTTTSQVNSKLVHIREQGGVNALGRVLTLVIVTDDDERTEEIIDAANRASREHPCRVIVVARGAKKASARLDAQIRVGGDAGASEVVVLRLYGPLADEGASCVVPMLLPDAPVVAWWPFDAPAVPAKDAIGQLAQRRITDSAAERNPVRALDARCKSYADGDTDLAWTRLTLWRAVLAAALDLPPYEKITGVVVTGEASSPSADLLAGWLAARLKVPVRRGKTTTGQGIVSVELERRSGSVTLHRPDGKTGTLTQPDQPPRRVALQRRAVADCLAEELRRLDPDEIYESALKGLDKVTRGRTPAKAPTPQPAAAKPRTRAKAST
jgi:glucose-6-phosphate dehydrogenase assembly protein OpcA